MGEADQSQSPEGLTVPFSLALRLMVPVSGSPSLPLSRSFVACLDKQKRQVWCP